MPKKFRKHLFFDGRYADKILKEEKTSTIRVGKYSIKRGRSFYIHARGHVLGKAVVTNVKIKSLKELTDEDAKRDGFKNKKELLKALKKHYGKLDKDTPVTIIEFKMQDRFKEEITSSDFAYGGYKATEIAKLALTHNIDLSEKEKEVLKTLLNTGSIRKTARQIGNPNKRFMIRKILKKIFNILVKEKIITPKIKNYQAENNNKI
ncbi:MAG: ASCH domain-containing protein [Candidatus Baldrarchaeia archaeon]